jgi:hypothetical protein
LGCILIFTPRFISIPSPFHLLSIPSSLMHLFNSCSHSPAGWSAFCPFPFYLITF